MDNTQTAGPSLIEEAVNKFYLLNEDLPATKEVLRRIFFEALRSNPTMLSSEDIEKVQSVVELLSVLMHKAEQR